MLLEALNVVSQHGGTARQKRARPVSLSLSLSLRAGTLKRSGRFTRDNINLRSRVVPRSVTRRRARKEKGDLSAAGNSALAPKVAGSRARDMRHRVVSWDRWCTQSVSFFFSLFFFFFDPLHPRVRLLVSRATRSTDTIAHTRLNRGHVRKESRRVADTCSERNLTLVSRF